MNIIKGLFVITGLSLGLYFGSSYYAYKHTDRADLRLEKLSSILKNDTNKTFLPPISDRVYWDNPLYSVPVLSEDQFDNLNLKGSAFLDTANMQLCLYPQNTFWIKPLEQTILDFIKNNNSKTNNGDPNYKFVINTGVTGFASAMANSITMLEPVLDPNVVTAAKAWIKDNLLSVFMSDYERAQYDRLGWGYSHCPWIEGPFYWTPACTTDLLYIALAIEEDPRDRAKIVITCIDLISFYFQSLDLQGGYPGGIRFWSSHFYYYIIMAERLLQASGGDINLYQRPFVYQLLKYPYESMLLTGESLVGQFYPVFGDNSNPVTSVRWSFKLLEKRVESWFPDLPFYTGYTFRYYKEALMSPYRVQTSKSSIGRPGNYTFFPSLGLSIFRDYPASLVLAFKGASAFDANKDFDVGSYSLFGVSPAGAIELLGEGGKESTPFDKGTQSKSKALLKVYQAGKPLPVIDGVFQTLSNTSRQNVVSHTSTSKIQKLEFNLLPFYDILGLQKLKRIVSYDGESLIVRDEFEADRPVEFQTFFPVRSFSGEIGERRIILSSPDFKFEVEVTSSTELKTITSILQPDDVTQVYRFGLNGRQLSGFIEYKIKFY